MITKNYIKMCEKAEEIQKAWKPKIGYYMYLKKNKQIYLITNVDKTVIFYINIEDSEDSWCYENRLKYYFIYLPTQEQLQEITKQNCYENNNFKSFISDFYYYLLDEYEEIDKCESLNEVWLCFYMSEKYSKIWTGEKWVKAE